MNSPTTTSDRLSSLRLRAEQLESQRLGNSLVKVGRLVMERTIERLRERGYEDLRVGFTTLLPHLDRRHGSRITELAERMGSTKQAVGQMVTQLQNAGYVRRRLDPQDGRARLVELTEGGFEVLLAGLEVFAEIETELAAELGSENLKRFAKNAEAVRNCLEGDQR
ncbi:MAG: MarR family transcriptional regulator [Myxococcota bacterium]|jgi:DNA-binding MarR family transcriptional regulator|nr:MarR family transcriptional regulator [Myxococcota bacterium]